MNPPLLPSYAFSVRLVLLLFSFVSLPAAALANNPSQESVSGELGKESDLRTTVSRLAQITSSWSPSFSPDGKTVAFVSNAGGEPQVWTVSSSGGWPRQITAFEDTISSVDWSPDGDWLAVSAAPGGGMNSQIYLVSAPHGIEVKRITPGDRASNWFGAWSGDGKKLGFSSNRRTSAAMDGYLYDLATEESTRVVENKGIGSVVELSHDASQALLRRVAGRGSNDIYLLDTASGLVELLTEHEGPGSFFAAFGGEPIYMASNADRDRVAFGFTRMGEGGAEPIRLLVERDDAELQGLSIAPSGLLAVLVWNVAGRSEVELIELAIEHVDTGYEGEPVVEVPTVKKRRPLAMPSELVGSAEFSADGRRLLVSGSGSQSPSNVYVVDVSSGDVNQITYSSHPGVDLDNLVRPKLVTYAAHDGLELSGWLYRPATRSSTGSDAPAPYVLSFHGGPEGQTRPSLNSTFQALLARGIGVFAPNIRGSSGFGKQFVNLDNQELRFDANRDLITSAEWLVDQGIADRERLGIMGGSYGGYAVMVAVTDAPKLFAAGANLFGMVNFETFFENTEPWMAAISGTEYGDPETQRDLLRRLSPIHRLDQVETPLLVLHGKNDTNVPVVEAEQVVENLERRDVPVQYILFEDEGHGFRKAKNRITAAVATVEWFEKYLDVEN